MPVISNIATALALHLQQEQFTPPLREVAVSQNLPAAAYPQATVSVEDELFGPAPADAVAAVTVCISCAQGREADARATVRELAHQLRKSLCRADGLLGLVKALSVRRISYSGGGPAQPGLPVVARAEIELEFKYCEPEA